jgi:hypothetical protein
MPTDHQLTFSRTSLNILILVCVVLILIFGQSSRDDASIDTPPVPKLDISIWQTDSGATVWFSPKLDDHIYIQLHYLAGFSFNHKPFGSGTSQLLASLLNHQARQMKLPTHVAITPDFIEVSIKLSTDPLVMNEQIKGLSALLYRPKLAADALNQAKKVLPNHLDELWQQAYLGHAYEGPKHGTPDSMSSIHRAQVQKFQQGFLHPTRVFASITGSISEKAAQVIMESLLPISLYPANTKRSHVPQHSAAYQQANVGLVVMPGSYEQAAQLANQMMMLNVLKLIQPTQIQLITGNTNNTLLIEQWPSLLSSIDTDLDSDIMRQAKRQSIIDSIERTQTALALSEFLVWLNRYHLPSSFLNKQFSIIENWQDKDWQSVKKQWLQSPPN